MRFPFFRRDREEREQVEAPPRETEELQETAEPAAEAPVEAAPEPAPELLPQQLEAAEPEAEEPPPPVVEPERQGWNLGSLFRREAAEQAREAVEEAAAEPGPPARQQQKWNFRGLFNRVSQLVTGRGAIDEDLYDELEETLIESDVGVQTAMRLVQDLRQAVRKNWLSSPEEVEGWLKGEIERILSSDQAEIRWADQPPTVILVVGVNGTGKTTSIAKLTHHLRGQGKRVLLAAADTFRAAAIDQLEVWAERLGVEVVRHKEGADPAAVVFDAIEAGKARGVDVVIADTAGRLHTKTNLMDELRKVARVTERALGRPADEVLLVLDATVGQNAVSQAKSFTDVLPVTGIVLAKMDGTARGGVIITVKDELGIPIKFAGTGEKPQDLDRFRPREFAEALFAAE